MIYLDYCATTPVNKEVLKTYVKVCENYIGNPNSIHRLGIESNSLLRKATEQIAELLNIKAEEIIYTSGSTEANSIVFREIVNQYRGRGKHIIISKLEHASINKFVKKLKEEGFAIDYVNLDSNGLVDLKHLKSLLKETTILVSIVGVDSEIGLLQPIEEIGLLLKEYPKCLFHVDVTQMVGKVNINLENIDLASFSAHKFYGLKGIGFLIKKEHIPLIRLGTPPLPLIVATSKALRLALEQIEDNYNYVLKLNKYIVEQLKTIPEVIINSNEYSLPYVINVSALNIKPDTFVNALSTYNIYISTKTACASSSEMSQAVYALTNCEKRARTSLRISLSPLTTEEEVWEFMKYFKLIKEQLSLNEGCDLN